MKYDWQKICDRFAKELKQFLEENGYEKFALASNTQAPNPNVDFLFCFLQKYNIPLNSEELDSEDLKNGTCGYNSYSWYNRSNNFCDLQFATICPAIRNEISPIKFYWRTEYLLSTIHPLTWVFESDIKEMSKIIDFDYIPNNDNYPENLTGEQLEWAEIQDINYKIITGETDPSKNPRWLGYTTDQRELIAKVYSLYLKNKNNFQNCVQIDGSKFK